MEVRAPQPASTDIRRRLQETVGHNRIECMFNRLKQFRRIATPYTKRPPLPSSASCASPPQNLHALFCEQDLSNSLRSTRDPLFINLTRCAECCGTLIILRKEDKQMGFKPVAKKARVADSPVDFFQDLFDPSKKKPNHRRNEIACNNQCHICLGM